jgi:peptidyl serine alpha-galactosyltransferase
LSGTTSEVHTVFSVDGSLYQRWQADLLAYSHHKVGQPGPLTRLLSSDGPPTPFAGTTFHTKPYFPHPVTGDYYPPYNRIMALRAWLTENPPTQEVILLVEPDCVFLGSLTGELVSRGHPVSHPIRYMDPVPRPGWRRDQLVQKHCSRPELVEPAGIPTVLIHRDDLMEVVPLWIEKTEDIRNDPKSRELAGASGWMADMWGYTCAAAEIGLRHKLRPLARTPGEAQAFGYACTPGEDQADLPIIHYCFPWSDAANRWVWEKRTYRPWEKVPDPPDDVPSASKALIGLLNEWVAMPEHQICLYDA